MAEDRRKRVERRNQRNREVEDSQKAMRASTAETQRLMDESDKMIQRHRRECEEDDAGA